MVTVYKHTSPSGKSYIGITKFDMEERLSQHIKQSRYGSEYMFHQAIRKYGIENFKSEILEICETLELANDREKYYISFYDTYDNGYNMTKGGYGRLSGWQHTEETKQKLKNKIVSLETREKLSNALTGLPAWNKGITLTEDQKKNMGCPHTEETKQKLSEIRTGTKHKEETKLKISEAIAGEKNPMFGKKHSDETKRKLSEIRTGITLSEETKLKISESNSGENNYMFGKNHTEETKQKLKNSQIGRMWIHNILLNESKRIYIDELEEYILDGWTRGRLKN